MTIDSIFNTIIRDLSQSPITIYDYYPTTQLKSKSYKIFEEDNNIVFKCLAVGICQDDIDITFGNKKLVIKSSLNKDDKIFKSDINESITLNSAIDVKNSFAKLEKGILTVTMPVDKKDLQHKILFK